MGGHKPRHQEGPAHRPAQQTERAVRPSRRWNTGEQSEMSAVQRVVYFLDLDDTLFASRRKTPDAAAEPVAYASDGRPLSYITARQRRFFSLLAESGLLVPTTGRNAAAFGRIDLPFDACHAICSFGGLVLTPGRHEERQPEPRWHAHISRHSAEAAPVLDTLLDHIASEAKDGPVDVRYRVIEDAGNPLYLSVKHNQEDITALAGLAERLRPVLPSGWVLHLNDNNMALMPPFLCKRHAVRWFLEEVVGEPVLSIGIGDSLTDLPFMTACDFALVPTGSQIDTLCLQPALPGVAADALGRGQEAAE